MPDEAGRKKVGDRDPAGEKAFKAETAKTRKAAKTAPTGGALGQVAAVEKARKAAKSTPTDGALGPVRRVREILKELADAVDPDEPRESKHVVEGKSKTVMDIVDEAVSGAKEDPI